MSTNNREFDFFALMASLEAHILIPRKKFLDYLGYDCYSGENDYFGYLVPDEPPTVLPKM